MLKFVASYISRKKRRDRQAQSEFATLYATPEIAPASLLLPGAAKLYVVPAANQAGTSVVFTVRGNDFQVEDVTAGLQYEVGWFEKGTLIEFASAVIAYDLHAGVPFDAPRKIAEI